MAGGYTDKSPKVRPAMQMRRKQNDVARGNGRDDPYGRDGSGSNKPAKALDSKDIRAGKQPHVADKVNSGKDSPIGRERPTQDGGPRKGQKSGVDFDIKGRTTSKDWGWSV